jgi:hypothetical protein
LGSGGSSGGLGSGILGAGGHSLASHPPGNPQPDSERPPDALRFHIRYDGSSAAGRAALLNFFDSQLLSEWHRQ